MQKSGPGAQPLPTNKKTTASYMTPPTLAGKKGVASMGVPAPAEKDLSKREKVSETSEKISIKSLNTSNMSKSLFEKLFEDVMGETDVDLGTAASDEAALGIEPAAESGDEVTLTLDRATAEKLHSMLGAILGGVEHSEDEGEEFEGGEEEGGEEEKEAAPAMGESIEVQAEPKELKANTTQFHKGKPDAIHGSTIKTNKGRAESGKIELQAEPKALGAKEDALQKPGMQKVVGKASTVGKSLFDV